MIGIFDSGYGGLTVLRALADAFPRRHFVYLGDHALAPYGNRSSEDIYRLTTAAVERLFGLGCRLVVLACNTAASTNLRRLQQEWLPRSHPEHRVLGVLVPMVEAITGVPWMADLPAAHLPTHRQTVAVFATRQTVLSNAYPLEIGKRAPGVRVVQQSCPSLVDLIETGAADEEIHGAVRIYVNDLMEKLGGCAPDVAMLGCTHYPLVAEVFTSLLPPGVQVLSQPDLVARSLEAYLLRHPEFVETDPPGLTFYTSGDPEEVSRRGTTFFGHPVTFHSITTAERPVSARVG